MARRSTDLLDVDAVVYSIKYYGLLPNLFIPFFKWLSAYGCRNGHGAHGVRWRHGTASLFCGDANAVHGQHF